MEEKKGALKNRRRFNPVVSDYFCFDDYSLYYGCRRGQNDGCLCAHPSTWSWA